MAGLERIQAAVDRIDQTTTEEAGELRNIVSELRAQNEPALNAVADRLEASADRVEALSDEAVAVVAEPAPPADPEVPA